MPQVTDSFVDPTLTRISVKYSNDQTDFIHKMALPPLQVDRKTGNYFSYDKRHLAIDDTVVSGLARANRVDFDYSKNTYGPLRKHALEIGLEDDLIEQHDSPLDPRTDATLTLTEKIEIQKEDEVAGKLFASGTMTQNTTLSGTSQWSDFANSDPFDDIQVGIDNVKSTSIKMANTIILGYQVWSKLRNHPDLIDRVKYTTIAAMTRAMLLNLFEDQGIKQILIGGAIKNTAVEGAADSLTYIWGKHCLIAHIEPTPTIRSTTVGYTLRLKGAQKVERFREVGVDGEFIKVGDYYEHKIIDVNAGYLIVDAIG